MSEKDGTPPAASLDGGVKSGKGSEGGRGGRKKYQSFLIYRFIFPKSHFLDYRSFGSSFDEVVKLL